MNRTASEPGTDAVPPLPCLCASLRRAARAVTQLYERDLRRSGIRVTQFTLLQALEVAGELALGQLGQFLALDSTTLSRTLPPLERRGWIQSIPGEDRRERRLVLTAAGRRELARVGRRWQRAQSRLREDLGAARWEELMKDLVEVTRVVQAART